jgi:hypothetical protein
MQVLKAGAIYFSLVFAAGFILGPVRILWLVPHVGVRAAELMEMPVMLVVIVFAARWTVPRWAASFSSARLLGMGMTALALILVAEFSLVLWLRGLSIPVYLAGRDPVSGTAYDIMLGVFAVMPLLTAPRL